MTLSVCFFKHLLAKISDIRQAPFRGIYLAWYLLVLRLKDVIDDPLFTIAKEILINKHKLYWEFNDDDTIWRQ